MGREIRTFHTRYWSTLLSATRNGKGERLAAGWHTRWRMVLTTCGSPREKSPRVRNEKGTKLTSPRHSLFRLGIAKSEEPLPSSRAAGCPVRPEPIPDHHCNPTLPRGTHTRAAGGRNTLTWADASGAVTRDRGKPGERLERDGWARTSLGCDRTDGPNSVVLRDSVLHDVRLIAGTPLHGEKRS